MPEASTLNRLLFVDDEASIRLTLPPVLERAGFDVRVAESVSDALFEINSRQFDILISDLNIGEEGDGFLVTSAMRHVQPNCLTFILTGYPAFETALQAIHNHVDDYLVKPVDIESLTRTLKDKVRDRTVKQPFGMKRLATILRQYTEQIVGQIPASAKNGKASTGTKQEITRSMKLFLLSLVDQLESGGEEANEEMLRSAPEYGKKRAQANCSASVLAGEFRCMEQEVYRVVQNNMTGMDIGTLISDLRKFSSGLHLLMERSLEAHGKTRPEPAKR